MQPTAPPIDLQQPHLQLQTGLQQYGGSRGVFTTCNLSAGTVVLDEVPFFVGPASAEVRALGLHAVLPMAAIAIDRAAGVVGLSTFACT